MVELAGKGHHVDAPARLPGRPKVLDGSEVRCCFARAGRVKGATLQLVGRTIVSVLLTQSRRVQGSHCWLVQQCCICCRHLVHGTHNSVSNCKGTAGEKLLTS